jgi:transcriptional regulator with XRE-family HTH domain
MKTRSLMNLSRQIRDLRYAKGWGPDELASRAKISRTALYQIERGNTSKPQAGTLRKICRALGVPLENLLEKAIDLNEGIPTVSPDATMAQTAMPAAARARGTSPDRAEELMEKFRLLLASPLAEGIARIVEESFRLLPIIPPPTSGEPPRYASPSEIDIARRGGSRSHNSN